jgi:hypothetical protein
MPGFALLAPIPLVHLQGAIELLKHKEFVLFGSDKFDVFEKTEVGSEVLIYVSHDDAEPLVTYRGTFGGIVGDPMQMRHLERQGYRPPSAVGEKFALFWKVSDVTKLAEPIALSDIRLATGAYLKGYSRGPLHVVG